MSDIGLTKNSRCLVTLTLEIPVINNYGPDATVAEIHRSAKASAVQRLIDITRGQGRIVGQPVVTMVLVDAQEV